MRLSDRADLGSGLRQLGAEPGFECNVATPGSKDLLEDLKSSNVFQQFTGNSLVSDTSDIDRKHRSIEPTSQLHPSTPNLPLERPNEQMSRT